MELIPIYEFIEENPELADDPALKESLTMSIDFYKKVGYTPPWICYYVRRGGELVGCAGIKGKPVNGTIEIAYGTFEQFQNQGIGTGICKILVDLSLKTDSSIRITARTLAENNFSTKILKKNKFKFVGDVYDPEDGNVWEWEYQK
ncbi:MAG TPA: GNAT family protein [Puia sp.]|jgi:ribosomal-protein-alanine N-acetyltransferase|nr:GNAT family protein [Puia sp.]